MSTQEVHRHITVLLNEAVAALNIRENVCMWMERLAGAAIQS